MAGQGYRLELDSTLFHTLSSGAPFADNSYYSYYSFKVCDCGGKGTCVQNFGIWSCQCVSPWAGANCEKCAPGYHGAGTVCIADSHCDANSCSGHGRCTDSEGYVQCVCYTGYESDGINLCSRCAPGYVGYPNCTIVDPTADRPVTCAAPLIPVTLNGPGYLGFNQRTHLSGEYYVDLQARSHDTTFTLQTASVIRVYTEPHWVDIDVLLFLVKPDSTTTLIDSRLTFNSEEVIYRVLAAGNYLVQFRFVLFFCGFVVILACVG